MSVPGGGDITALLRQLGREALEDEGERAGLVPRAGRMRCPWTGCEHKTGVERDAVAFAGKDGHFRIYCHACEGTGDLVDLLQRTRAFSKEEAIAHVRGQPVPERPRPELRVVGSRPPEEAGKMEVAEVRRLWESMALTHPDAQRYLETRSLGGAMEAGLVRFVDEAAKDKRLTGRSRQGYVIGALASDIVGEPRGIQLRLARPARTKDEDKIVSVKGSATGRAFFGTPGLIEASPVIAVCEGLPDTLAVQLWTDERVCVVGAAGKGVLKNLPTELEHAGIDVTGKLFLLFPQNDRPENYSRKRFIVLRTLLIGRGARVEWMYTPDHHADVAAWWQDKKGALTWPPPELRAALGKEPGDEAEPLSVLPKGVAVPIPTKFESKTLAQDFSTLCMLLDDPSYRETIFNSRGELSLNEMTTEVRWGERDLAEVDLSNIRYGIERIPASNNNKPLKFAESDIEKALRLVARRRLVHPVREWLQSLKWDGKERLEPELPLILGHAAGSLEARLLRRWLVAAVARAMEPGCKADNVLILLGKQRAKKSTFFDKLGGQWFTDSDVVPGDKDGQLKMRKKWIIEWGELDNIKSSRSMEAVKKFLSQRTDFFRNPYGKDTVERERHCLLCGTTNEDEIFSDPTGNFRFWPIQLRITGPRIDAAWLEDHRDQLFAEAVSLYEGGRACPQCRADRERCSEHRWWLTDEEDAELGHRNKHLEIIDAWQHRISDHLEEFGTLPSVTVDQVLKGAFQIEPKDMGKDDQMRVAKVLRQLGWKSDRLREGSGWRRVWLRPEVTP